MNSKSVRRWRRIGLEVLIRQFRNFPESDQLEFVTFLCSRIANFRIWNFGIWEVLRFGDSGSEIQGFEDVAKTKFVRLSSLSWFRRNGVFFAEEYVPEILDLIYVLSDF